MVAPIAMVSLPAPVVANVLVGALTVLSLVIFLFAWRAWAYSRESRSLLLALSFLLLFAKSLVLLAGLFLLDDWLTLLLASVGFDVAILLGFYLSSLR